VTAPFTPISSFEGKIQKSHVFFENIIDIAIKCDYNDSKNGNINEIIPLCGNLRGETRMPTRQSTNRSAERMLDILDCFMADDRLMLMEIAKEAELPVSTAYRLVQTLEERKFLKRDDSSKRFSLGEKVGDLLQVYTGGRFDLLRCAAMRPMEALSGKHNETARLFVRDGGYKLCIEAVESTRDLRHIVRIGERHDLVRGAAGKVLLAHMPAPQRQAILEERNLDAKIEEILSGGYAVSYGEREEGLVGIAAPIFAGQSQLVAAVSMSGPISRFMEEALPDKIRDTVACAERITGKLAKYRGGGAGEDTS